MTLRLGQLVAVLAFSAVALAGCSEQDAQDAVDQAADRASTAIEDADLPNVDWGKHPDELRNRLERLADNADCAGLRRELAEVEGTDSALTRYIEAQLRQADC